MKHLSNKMDESDEYLHQTLSSHFKIILNYFEAISNFSFSENFDFDYLESSIRSLIMKPSTSLFLISIIILLFFSQTFDFWLNVLHNKFPFKLITRYFLRTSFSSGNLKNVIYELKANQIGVYAIQGRRPHMEDSFSFKFDTLNGECLFNGRKLENLKQSNALNQTNNIEMIAVFDGHGGKTASNYAQENLLNAFKKSFDELIIDNNLNQCKELNIDTISKILTEQILKLDSHLCDRLRQNSDIAGTTALIALRIVDTNQLIIANIGDSRGVLCDQKGNTIALSFDHKPNTPVELKRIYDAGGFVKFNGVWRVAGILACSRALGDFPLKEKNYVVADPDILTFNLNDLRPKFCILASDGLFDFFSNEAAVKFVKDKMEELLSNRFSISKNELSLELAKQLTHEAYKRGSTDNITVVVWIFDYVPVEQSAKQATSHTATKEHKSQKIKKCMIESDDTQTMHKSRSRFDKIENKFARDIIFETEKLTCDIESISEFKVSEHLIEEVKLTSDQVNDDQSLDNQKQKDESNKKKCSKKNKKFNLLNLKLSVDKESNSNELKLDVDKKNDEINEIDEINKKDCDETIQKQNELNDEIDTNPICEVRLKDEYNLHTRSSPKKLKNHQTNQIINANDDQINGENENDQDINRQDINQNVNIEKLKPDQSNDEFFECKNQDCN